LEEEGPNHIVERADGSLNLPIMSRGVRARHSEVSAVGEEEGAGVGVVKLAPIVALDRLDGASKLCGNESKEIR
jgi:hypothetical protein